MEFTDDWKGIFPLFSTVVVITLFLIERRLSYGIRRREIERTWYYKVLIDPSLHKIDAFFDKVIEQYEASCSLLDGSKHESHSVYNSIQSQEIGKFQRIKREFEIGFVTPIIHRYAECGNQLQNGLLDLEDNFSSFIDEEKFSTDDIEQFSIVVAKAKAMWYKILYQPISKKGKKKRWFMFWVKKNRD